MSFFLGIDFGTSGARAIAINATAQICAQVSQSFALGKPESATWRSVLFNLIEQIPEAVRSQLQAIAVNGTSSTVLLCDATGQPLTEPLMYHDDRARVQLDRLRQFLANDRYRNAPSQANVLSATSSLVKLLWWQQQPIYTQAQYLLHQADWLGFLLHGKFGISDYHNSLKLGYDVGQLCYPAWLAELGVMPVLPRVVPPGTAIAPVQPSIVAQLNLPPTCQVVAGTTDSIAAFLASGASIPGEAVTSLGSTLVLKLLSQTPVEHSAFGIYSHRLGDRWLVGGASNTGGAVLKQFFTPDELERLSGEIEGDRESPLDYYPLLKPGERFPVNDPQLPPRLEPRPENPVEFLHGLLESMARIEAQGYEQLQNLGATPLQQVYTAGGGAMNAAWTAIRSRHLGVCVLQSPQTEAAYGTALLALGAIAPQASF